jgi:hypothetical protein
MSWIDGAARDGRDVSVMLSIAVAALPSRRWARYTRKAFAARGFANVQAGRRGSDDYDANEF